MCLGRNQTQTKHKNPIKFSKYIKGVKVIRPNAASKARTQA